MNTLAAVLVRAIGGAALGLGALGAATAAVSLMDRRTVEVPAECAAIAAAANFPTRLTRRQVERALALLDQHRDEPGMRACAEAVDRAIERLCGNRQPC